MAPPTKPLSQGQKLAAAIGAVALIAGTGLLLWGLAPAKGFGAAGAAFGGGPVPDDLNEQINAAMDEMMARAWASGLGFVGILGGIIALKEGLTQKELTVEEQVNARLEEIGLENGAQNAPAPIAPPAAPAAPVPAPPEPATGCPTCGAKLIAGGTFCRTCGPVT